MALHSVLSSLHACSLILPFLFLRELTAWRIDNFCLMFSNFFSSSDSVLIPTRLVCIVCLSFVYGTSWSVALGTRSLCLALIC